MLGTPGHYLTDCLDRVYCFTSEMRLDEAGNPKLPDVQQCPTFARQTLDDIAESIHDPFHYRLLDLWLDVFQQPWAQPRSLSELLDDLARAIGRGDLMVYLDDNPNWHKERTLKAGSAASRNSADADDAAEQPGDNARTQANSPSSSPEPTDSSIPASGGNGPASGAGQTGSSTQPPESAGTTNQSGQTATGEPSPSNERTCTGGEPISLITGEELLEQTDFTLPGPLPLAWTRTYRTSHAHDGGLGAGWSSLLSETLTEDANQLWYWNQEGRAIPFPRPEAGQYSENLTEGLALTRLDDGRLRVVDGEGIGRSFQWLNGAWRPVAIDDRFDNQWRFHYADDGAALPILLESSWGTRVRILTERGRVVAVESLPDDADADSTFRWIEYGYDASGDLVSVTDPEGHAETYAYRNHVIVRRTLKTGFSFHFEWDRHDPHARCIRQWGDRGIYDYRFEWDPANRHTRCIDSNGGVLAIDYNDKGLPLREVDPEGGVTVREYDDTGLLVRQTDPNGRVTRYHHDSRRRLTHLVNAAGELHRVEYNDRDQPVAITDPAANTWRREYNSAGAPTAVVDPAGNRHETRYNPMGLPSLMRDPRGHERKLLWSQKGELVGERLPNGLAVKYEHDELGRITARQIGQQAPTRYHYNRNGRITRVVQPDGREINISYNEAGRPTSIRDASGALTQYEYDGLSQVVRKIDPRGQVFTYEYDKERNLVGLINEKGERYQLAYDRNERLIEEIGFDGRRQQYGYDPVGNLTEQIELWRQGGQDTILRTGFERDAAGRLIRRTEADNATTLYSYDANGRLSSATNADAKVSFQYDALGRLVAEQQNGQTLRHRYDPVGNRIETRLPDGQILSYDYDEMGGYRSVAWNQDTIASVERDELGREINRHQGNLLSQFDYDPAGRLSRHRVINASQKTAVIQRDYDYNDQGNLALIDDMGKGVTRFQYDALERLSQVEGFANEQFDFDPAGNLLAYQQDDEPAEKGNADGNRLTLLGDRKFDYDERGNLVRERRGKNGKLETHYHYNAANQLVAVEKDGKRFEYRYDPFGRRIQKVTPEATTNFLWNGDVLAWEEQDHNKTYYVYEPGSFRPLAQVRNGAIYHYHLDHLGTPREMTDAEGNLVWSVQYRAYGSLACQEVALVENNLRFQGQYFDQETGLHYNRFRYYDPSAGRFIHQDPIGLEGGANLYEYAPNPTGWVDPLGLTCKEDWRREQRVQDGIDDLRNGRDATVNSYKEADEVLFGAFPNAQKHPGAGPKDGELAKRQISFFREQAKKPNNGVHFHKDYKHHQSGKHEGVLYGHEGLPDEHPHKRNPHVNVKGHDSNGDSIEATIYIRS